jgi:hypothetical protein
MAGRDRRLQRIAAQRAPSDSARSSAARPRRISSRSQRARSCSIKQHRPARRVDTRRAARSLQLHQRDQAVHLGFAGREFGQHAAQPQRLVAQRGRIQSSPAVAV